MKILIAGSSGLVGSALRDSLRRDGHTVLPLVRPPIVAGAGQVAWNPETGEFGAEAAAGADAVINVAGASVAEGRWTERRKQVLRTSRIEATRGLVDAMAKLEPRPGVFVCASAVGYYGDRGDEKLDENSAAGTGFLAELVRDWEAEANRAATFGIRSVMLRLGIVLTARGGALAQMIGPFRLGIGGRLGSGHQWMSWLSMADTIGMFRAAIAEERYQGAYNAVAPEPVTNAEFTRVLGHVLHRPTLFPVPAAALRAMFGEMAGEMLLASQRVAPKRAVQNGYSYSYQELELALRAALIDS